MKFLTYKKIDSIHLISILKKILKNKKLMDLENFENSIMTTKLLIEMKQ